MDLYPFLFIFFVMILRSLFVIQIQYMYCTCAHIASFILYIHISIKHPFISFFYEFIFMYNVRDNREIVHKNYIEIVFVYISSLSLFLYCIVFYLFSRGLNHEFFFSNKAECNKCLVHSATFSLPAIYIITSHLNDLEFLYIKHVDHLSDSDSLVCRVLCF